MRHFYQRPLRDATTPASPQVTIDPSRLYEGPGYCEASNRLEATDGDGIWSLTGRGLDGTPSLDEHPTTVTAGILYIDPTTTRPAPPNTDDPAERGCS